MKIKLPNRSINVTLNTNRIRIGLPGTAPVTPVNPYIPSLDFSDARNSQYIAIF